MLVLTFSGAVANLSTLGAKLVLLDGCNFLTKSMFGDCVKALRLVAEPALLHIGIIVTRSVFVGRGVQTFGIEFLGVVGLHLVVRKVEDVVKYRFFELKPLQVAKQRLGHVVGQK